MEKQQGFFPFNFSYLVVFTYNIAAQTWQMAKYSGKFTTLLFQFSFAKRIFSCKKKV
jgi:hypothetical protein